MSWACVFKNRTLLIVTLEADKGHKNRRQMGIRSYSTAYRQVLKSTILHTQVFKSTVLHTVTTWYRHDNRHDNGKRTRAQNYSYHCAFLNNSYDHAEVVYVPCTCPWKCNFTAQHWWLQFLCLNRKKLQKYEQKPPLIISLWKLRSLLRAHDVQIWCEILAVLFPTHFSFWRLWFWLHKTK